MHYFLTEEQQMIVDICRQIVNERIIPVRAEAIFSGFLSLKNTAAWAPGSLKYALLLKNSAGAT
jgi:hypothetical protein